MALGELRQRFRPPRFALAWRIETTFRMNVPLSTNRQCLTGPMGRMAVIPQQTGMSAPA